MDAMTNVRFIAIRTFSKKNANQLFSILSNILADKYLDIL